ncbi:chaperone Hsp90 [Nitrospirillum viridazoti Y2]|uniref:Chaperone protein HtpG n=1 Tax=Nitrospirillum amazonense TaxID=28077 RepID=A0A560HMK9_9PROT|nr:molecular chaperone HtpG [Nitrospirillum amazonense]EGY01551.1 chaperone Hsp90 [Nitrospirillum amazonense Y2]TWB46524.1 molecular chaperone HtpG [Nitrospirillum amazonense]
MSEEKLSFQAEVSRLLDIVAHSLYSEKEVFLRELISNASDACDKLRYASLTQPELTAGDANFRITLTPDTAARTLTIADNGIGMNRDDLVENLGTIARSGTANFMAALSQKAEAKKDGEKDVSLIGQFGVGFYSAFMVAGEVEVYSRKAGETQGWRWTSDGKGSFTVGESDDAPARGSRIVLHLRDGEDDYLQTYRLQSIVKKYSDHISIPVLVGDDEKPANAASALWTRPKSEITTEQYKEFYHHVGHAFDDPWLTLHWRAEGVLEYTNLLFIPEAKPFDLFEPERKHRVKLYVRRVFITEGPEGLIPAYLRFLRGVVDSEDLPLNVSREMLQHNPMLAKMRTGIAKRVLGDLARKADDADSKADYARFWENFGAVLKEGLYEEREQRDTLLKLLRAHSTHGGTHGDELVSLEDYVGRMKPGQDAIYYITGEDKAALARSPHLEGFRAKGVEVLFLTDAVDEFWLQSVTQYKDHAFKSVTRGGADLANVAAEDKNDETPKAPEDSVADLVALAKLTLGDAVKDVRTSERLRESAVCLVADEGDMDIHLERMLKAHRRLDETSKRILEVNPAHPLIRRLADLAKANGAGGAQGEALADAAWLLLDQARILEGEPLPDPVAFGRRLAMFVEKGLA